MDLELLIYDKRLICRGPISQGAGTILLMAIYVYLLYMNQYNILRDGFS